MASAHFFLVKGWKALLDPNARHTKNMDPLRRVDLLRHKGRISVGPVPSATALDRLVQALNKAEQEGRTDWWGVDGDVTATQSQDLALDAAWDNLEVLTNRLPPPNSFKDWLNDATNTCPARPRMLALMFQAFGFTHCDHFGESRWKDHTWA
jgi:hypothetical protein